MTLRNLLLLAALGALFGLGCSSGTAACTNLTRTACDFDAGNACPEHQTCVSSTDAIDPCPSGAAGCCFQACTQDSDCPSDQLCASGTCSQGRCASDE
jgi:hypothetical protein